MTVATDKGNWYITWCVLWSILHKFHSTACSSTHDVPVTFYLFVNYGTTYTLEGRKENLPSLAVLTGGVQVLFSENRVKGRVKDVWQLRRQTQNKHHREHLSTGAPVPSLATRDHAQVTELPELAVEEQPQHWGHWGRRIMPWIWGLSRTPVWAT